MRDRYNNTKYDTLEIVYHDSARPDRVRITLSDTTIFDLSTVECADLSERLANVVRSHGYKLVAEKETRNVPWPLRPDPARR